ncbi:MAG: hypothetical protein K2J84_03900 [Bacteroidaceae bacterium]|nr:hypothetical protein [Bacteroidaceae bacterium]
MLTSTARKLKLPHLYIIHDGVSRIYSKTLPHLYGFAAGFSMSATLLMNRHGTYIHGGYSHGFIDLFDETHEE